MALRLLGLGFGMVYRFLVVWGGLLWVVGCAQAPEVVDRPEGVRTPLSQLCDDMDQELCLLPWPSNRFTVEDETTETGLRLDVETDSLNRRDDASSINWADGFSRVTPVVTHFPRAVDDATLDAIQVYNAQAGSPAYGARVPVRYESLALGDGGVLVFAYPQAALEAASDHVVVVLDTLRAVDGSTFAPSDAAVLALDQRVPATVEEAAVVGYFAPVRTFLERQSIASAQVLRVWDFTTRSAEDGRLVFRALRDRAVQAVKSGDVRVAIDAIESSDDVDIALFIHGRLEGLPGHLRGDEGFEYDLTGLPLVQGRVSAPFRIMIPAGEGDYRFAMYGHGTGGNEDDRAFDAELAALGLAKVNLRFSGWTDDEVVGTFVNLTEAFTGTHAAAAYLVESMAHGAAIQEALRDGVLADALSAETIAEQPNPAAGRRPSLAPPVWVGGSLGGTTGLLYSAASEEIEYAVVNVPGAAWTHWIWHSETFQLIRDILVGRYRTTARLALALAISQTNLDLADGAVWADVISEQSTTYLIQQSMGDPILPNPGTDLVAIVTEAQQVGEVLAPIYGVERVQERINQSGITQYRTTAEGAFDIHGFAARDRPAGRAAREQIFEYLRTALEGRSRIVTPTRCPQENCDFTVNGG